MRENTEKWMELCALAAKEQDPKKFAVLILEINFMLETKERRLLSEAKSSSFGEDESRSPLQSKL